ncbi:MAG: metal-dependent hydrolase, partial [Candidatus Hermodarchaeota archaeon]
KWGLVWGSIFPDIDLIASIIWFLFTQDFDSAGFLHRSYTHGFFTMGLVLIVGQIASRTRSDWKWVSMFSIAFSIGMFSHVFYDLLDGYVAVLAPFSFERYSITGFDFETALGATGVKIWNAWDAMSDVIFFLTLWYWSTHKTKIPNEQSFAKKLYILSFIFIVYFGILMGVAFTNISVEMHFILIYLLWGPVSLPLSSIIAQIKMRETIQDFSFLDIRK